MTWPFAPSSKVHNDAAMAGRIYSVGYEGLTLPALIDRLTGAKVTTLVDVRLNAVSRRPGFSKKALTAALADAGIAYVHEKELGNPQDNRNSFRVGDGSEGRTRMRAQLDNGSAEALSRVADLAEDQRIAVMCVERERNRCHRDVITDVITEQHPDIEVVQIL